MTTPIEASGCLSRNFTTTVAAMVLVAALAAPSAAYERPGKVHIASLASNGELADVPDGWDPYNGCNVYNATSTAIDISKITDISSDGRWVSFFSLADNLVPNDTNRICDVFVRDLKSGTTDLVSQNSLGQPAQGAPGVTDSSDSSISADGRFVAFTSNAPNLTPGDTNPGWDVFVRDRHDGTTERICVSLAEAQGTLPGGACGVPLDASGFPSISDDGRYVAFKAKTLGSRLHVFVHDRRTSTTRLVSAATDGSPGNGHSRFPSISPDGRFVAFDSQATNLTPDHTGSLREVYLHDLKTGQTEMVSVPAGDPAPRLFQSFTTSFVSQAVSAKGRHVVFTSAAALAPNDTNQSGGAPNPDVYVWERKTGRFERVSVSSTGAEGSSWSRDAAISANGRYVTFHSNAPEFLPWDSPATRVDVYVYDRETGALEWMPLQRERDGSLLGQPYRCQNSKASGLSRPGGISGSGRHVAFWSCAEDVVPRRTNEDWHIYIRDRGSELGTGGFDGDGPSNPSSPGGRICVTSDICIPPGGAAISSDATDDVGHAVTEQGANLYSTSLAYRPRYEDLFARIELEHMPQVVPSISPIVYGLRFEIKGRRYEARASSLLGGTFGLFDCTGPASLCIKVADLRGGYGTTGMRVVFSLPLEMIGLQDGGDMSDVEAFSGLGSYITGATKMLDSAEMR